MSGRPVNGGKGKPGSNGMNGRPGNGGKPGKPGNVDGCATDLSAAAALDDGSGTSWFPAMAGSDAS